ncbi:MAG: phosphoglucosamine mutase [Candidatus Margulisiibacteriota bacterium]
MTLKISISGIRGITGESLTNEVVDSFAAAYAMYTKNGRIVVGSDGRSSGAHIRTLVIGRLNKSGCEVIDVGIAPTPTIQLAVKYLSADGGIIVTASHNPPQWNGLKFVRSDGIFLNEKQAAELIGIYEKLPKSDEDKNDLRTCVSKTDNGALDRHIDLVMKKISAAMIQKRAFKVAIDCCNGAGSVIAPKLLKKLGCEIIAINTDPGQIPPRGLEPIPSNLSHLCRIVKEFGADIGFAQDPDADRLAIVSDCGEAIGEEYSLALAVLFVLSKNTGVKNKIVVTNLSTSRITQDAASMFGARTVRTKVGEVNVSEKIKELGALIGGEGNGGIIWPEIGFGRDSICGIGLILDLLADREKTVSQLVDSLPKYTMIKDKIDLPQGTDPSIMLAAAEKRFSSAKIDKTDGIKIDMPDGWLHIRASNTEPIIRIIAEGTDKKRTKDLIEEIKKLGSRPAAPS